MKVIADFRAPNSKEEVRSFVNYVGKFIRDLADITELLRILLKADIKFMWGPDQENVFQHHKTQLSNIATLSDFDLKRVVADGSPVALGVVLLQFDADGDPKIIYFENKSLS